MGETFRTYIASFLLVVLSVLLVPFDLFHQLSEEHHDEVHQCESDICFSEFEAHCELCDLNSPVYHSQLSAYEYSLQPTTRKTRLEDTSVLITFSGLLPLNKAPPVS